MAGSFARPFVLFASLALGCTGCSFGPEGEIDPNVLAPIAEATRVSGRSQAQMWAFDAPMWILPTWIPSEGNYACMFRAPDVTYACTLRFQIVGPVATSRKLEKVGRYSLVLYDMDARRLVHNEVVTIWIDGESVSFGYVDADNSKYDFHLTPGNTHSLFLAPVDGACPPESQSWSFYPRLRDSW